MKTKNLVSIFLIFCSSPSFLGAQHKEKPSDLEACQKQIKEAAAANDGIFPFVQLKELPTSARDFILSEAGAQDPVSKAKEAKLIGTLRLAARYPGDRAYGLVDLDRIDAIGSNSKRSRFDLIAEDERPGSHKIKKSLYDAAKGDRFDLLSDIAFRNLPKNETPYTIRTPIFVNFAESDVWALNTLQLPRPLVSVISKAVNGENRKSPAQDFTGKFVVESDEASSQLRFFFLVDQGKDKQPIRVDIKDSVLAREIFTRLKPIWAVMSHYDGEMIGSKPSSPSFGLKELGGVENEVFPKEGGVSYQFYFSASSYPSGPLGGTQDSMILSLMSFF